MERQNITLKKSIAVLLTCHNRRLKTLACLEALFASSLPEGFSINVFLVDDGSSDGTGLAVKQNFPEVNVIQGTGNLFWNRGMILAWQTASKENNYDFFFWLNDDTNLTPTGMVDLLKDMQTSGGNAIICGATCDPITHELSYSGAKRLRRKGGPSLTPNGHIQACEISPGNCVLIPAVVYEKIGMLDPIFEHAIGDFDYGLRAISAGFKMYITSEYIASCSTNPNPPLWCLPQFPIKFRIKNLYSPLGYSPPGQYFIYVKRHFGIWVAILNYFTIHVRLLFPKLWL